MLRKGTKLLTTFDEYTIESQFKQGGNGTVYKVRNIDGITYAVKAINKATTTRNKIKRFRNELNFCLNNKHKNIIEVIDHGVYSSEGINVLFYVMPFYSSNLRDRINTNIPNIEVLPLFVQILNAIQFSHEKGVWHRDIKPENILISENGIAVLADFGIAHFCADDLVTFIETNNTERLANFQYAAPEQRCGGGIVDGHVDVYAAGLILNEMFTGQIISGVNYKTIDSVNKNFGYLDKIVERMVYQQQVERVWPISKIAMELLATETETKANNQLLELAKGNDNADEEFKEIPIPVVKGLDYSNGTLTVYLEGLDYYYSEAWFGNLRNASYFHQSILGYGPSQLHMRSPGVLLMNIPPKEARNIELIVKNIKGWLAPATAELNVELTTMAKRRKKEKEDAIQAELTRLRAEERIRASLRSIEF